MKPRFFSLDVFRGSVVLFMFFINYLSFTSYGLPIFFQHYKAGLFLPGDMIVPLFHFMLGISLAISIGKKRARGDSWLGMALLYARRSFFLIALGLALDFFLLGGLQWGVLQALGLSVAISYFAIKLGKKERAAVALLMVASYAAIVSLDKEGAVAWLEEYGGPVGALSLAPIAIFGTIAGEIAYANENRKSKDENKNNAAQKKKRTLLLGAGAALLVLGLMLSFFMPFGQARAMPSFSLAGTGICFVAFSFFTALESEGKGKTRARNLAPLEMLGRNSMSAWVLQYLLVFYPVTYAIGGTFLPWYLGIGLAAMLMAISYVILDMMDFFGAKFTV